MLRLLGCSVDLAEDGRAAVKKATESRYDIILMDCQMPNMDGFAATVAIREFEQRQGKTEQTPIIAVTANALVTDRDRCLVAGMSDYLSKPFRLAELKATIERSLSNASTMTAATDNSATPAFCPQELEELEQLGASKSEIEDIVHSFIDSSRESIASMASAIESQNRQALGQLAHKLQGGCGQVGALKVAELCAQLRARASAGGWDSLREMHALIADETNTAHDQLGTRYYRRSA